MLYGRMHGEAELYVKRHARRRPIVATVFYGAGTVDPAREMGGPELCPSAELAVWPDGTWSVHVRTIVDGVPVSTEVASGTLDADSKGDGR